MATLSREEIDRALRALSDWQQREGKLVLERNFSSFAEAMRFVNAVAEAAESQDHHPDIDVRYDKVRLTLLSHDVNGITRRDLRLAETISTLT